MKRLILAAGFALAACLTQAALGDARVLEHVDHEIMLSSSNPVLAANKRLVYDFWREVLEANHIELAEKYLDEGYIQHNPNIPDGRAKFVEFFSRRGDALDIQPRMKSPLVAIVAEGELVVLSFVHRGGNLIDPKSRFTTTWFDMFRVVNGKIVEHWDPAQKG
jgi:predicted SnoaL-like aldol condensation-catalyzing enzyme